MIRLIYISALLAAIVCAAVPALAQQAGWIGVSIEEQKDGGALVHGVEPNSPAAKAGLKEGDVIIQYNKEDVIGVQQLTRLVRETPVGRTVDVKIRRDNREQTLQVTTEGMRLAQRLGGFDFNLPGIQIQPKVQINMTYSQSGIRVEQLTDQLRDFFGVFSNSGVLVSSVDQGSAAEKAGVKAGDVVTSIDGKSIRTTSDFNREMRAGGARTVLKVFRDKQEREITVQK
jgi:serine protease Do